jgi:hypothetical protein
MHLQERLREYKATKRKAEVKAADYTSQIAEIDSEFAKLKAEIITRLTAAETYEEYDMMSNVTNYNLAWLVRDIVHVKNNATQKTFASPQEANKAIDSVRAGISKMWERLKK